MVKGRAAVGAERMHLAAGNLVVFFAGGVAGQVEKVAEAGATAALYAHAQARFAFGEAARVRGAACLRHFESCAARGDRVVDGAAGDDAGRRRGRRDGAR